MELQYKANPAFTLGIDGLTVRGIFAVHGNVDNGGDRGYPGLVGDSPQVDGRSRARFLWQHDSGQPPIATIDQVFEVARVDLPETVLRYAPAATGGVGVKRTYLSDDVTTLAGWVFKAVAAGAITEMSYAYEPKDWKYTTEDGKSIRELFKIDLYDISDVNWGMNPATSADGMKRGQPLSMQHTTVLAAVDDYIKRCKDLASLRAKEGRVLSSDNRKRIADAVTAMEAAKAALTELLDATDPGKAKQRYREAYQEWQATQRRIAQLGVTG